MTQVRAHQPHPDGISTLRIAAYNIAHGRGDAEGLDNSGGMTPERRARLEAIGTLLKEHRFDVVVLNEVDFDAHWSGGANQAMIIAEAGGFPFVATQNNLDVALPFRRLRFGNAVLSQFPIVGAASVDLPPMSVWEDRFAGNHDAIHARINVPWGSGTSTLELVGVHLEVRDALVRARCADALIEFAAGLSGPVVIAGDFNSTPAGLPGHIAVDGGNAVERLLQSQRWKAAPHPGQPDRGFTFPSRAPARAIDWIFYPSAWDSTNGVLQSPYSDHLPVWVELAPQPR